MTAAYDVSRLAEKISQARADIDAFGAQLDNNVLAQAAFGVLKEHLRPVAGTVNTLQATGVDSLPAYGLRVIDEFIERTVQELQNLLLAAQTGTLSSGDLDRARSA